jgi:peptidoglycan/LPS O-acetylase OafA/YrhL
MATSVSKYRRDIDGLRAIAIIAVLLYHLKFRYLEGGFVGVDIFFVISGYLITQHVYTEINAGTFSLVRFYERRIRRIFPALMVMLAVSAVMAYFLLFPGDMIDYANSLVASVLSFSNFYYWQTSGYFSGGDKPLLHTWSLALEEQFYVLLPATLLLLRNASRKIVWLAIALITLSSLVLSALTVRRFPEATFYLLPARAWELLCGSMLAVGMVRVPSGRAVRQVVGLLGLLLILAAMVYYTPKMPFPGPLALMPCLGTLMVIAAGGVGDTVVDRVLSIKPMVGVGLISYSLYLWHVPIIYFQQCTTWLTFGKVLPRLVPFISVPQAITAERYITLTLASFLIASLSWKFVEQPFRFGSWKPRRKPLFYIAGWSSFILVVIGTSIVYTRGLPSRFSPRVLEIASFSKPSDYRLHTCFITQKNDIFNQQACLHEESVRENWLIVGDSHAAMIAGGFVGAEPAVNVMQATHTGCKPVFQARFEEDPSCVAFMKFILSDYLANHRPDIVFLAANWQSYDLPRLTTTINFLHARGQRTIVIGPIMQYDSPLPRLLAAAVQSDQLTLAASHRVLSYDTLDSQMRTMASTVWKTRYISYRDLLCASGRCQEWAKADTPLQADASHLTDAGSLFAAQRMRDAGLLSR